MRKINKKKLYEIIKKLQTHACNHNVQTTGNMAIIKREHRDNAWGDDDIAEEATAFVIRRQNERAS